MATVTTNFEEAGRSAEFVLAPGQSATYAVAGTWTGFAYFEKSEARNQWEVVAGGEEDTNFSGTIANEGTSDIRLRIRAEDTDAETPITGTVETTIADVNDVVQELKDKYGRVWARVTDEGFELTGNLTVEGTATLEGPITAPPITSSGVGAVSGATVVATEQGDGVWHKTILTCTAFPLGAFGDEAGQGQFAGAKVYTFPEGLILTQGAVIDGAVTLATPAIDEWNGDIGLGVEAPTDHQDATNKLGQVMPGVSSGTAAAKIAVVDAVSVAAALTESGARWRDGTTTPIELFLNLLVDDDAAHDDTITGTFTGTITILWAHLGDK